MDYLSREGAPLPADLWNKIDATIVSTAKSALVGRRFLPLYGPLGVGVQSINIDQYGNVSETEGSPSITTGRQYVELPVLYNDFTLLWRDIEVSERLDLPVDLSAAVNAAITLARKEDELIFLGNKSLGYEGLLTAKGVTRIQKGDWREGETPVTDVCQGLTSFSEYGLIGKQALVLSQDLYLQLQRIQPGTGITEIERVKRLVDGRLFVTPVMGLNKAVLINAQPQFIDLAVGQDLDTAYLETKDLSHVFRVLETVLLRIKCKNAVVVFE